MVIDVDEKCPVCGETYNVSLDADFYKHIPPEDRERCPHCGYKEDKIRP